jgi:hypothetical protein
MVDRPILVEEYAPTFSETYVLLTLSQVYLHHVLTVDRSKPPPNFVAYCLSEDELVEIPNPMGMLFLGGGSDANGATYTTPDQKIKSGYYIKNNTFAMTADIVNYNTKNTTVYITYDLEYVPGKLGADAAATLISVTGCMGPGFKEADDEQVTNHTSPSFPIRKDGWIINARKSNSPLWVVVMLGLSHSSSSNKFSKTKTDKIQEDTYTMEVNQCYFI